MLGRQVRNIDTLPWMKPPGPGGPNRTHLSFVFLRVSVPPWCKGLVFGCGFVALSFKALLFAGMAAYSPLISFATLALCFSFFTRFLLSSRLTEGGGPRRERESDFTALVALNLPGFFFLGMPQFNQSRFHRKGRKRREGGTKEKHVCG